MKKPLLLRLAALKNAQTFAGKVTENPPGSNRGPLIDRWNLDACGMVGVFWCLSFIHGMFKMAGFNLPGGASVGNLLAAATSNGWVVARPLRGDLACYEFGEGSWAYDDHVEIIERVLALRWNGRVFTGFIRTIGGNTSGQGMTGSQSNGGGVFRRWRWINNGIGAKYVRVPGTVA